MIDKDKGIDIYHTSKKIGGLNGLNAILGGNLTIDVLAVIL